MAFDLKTWLSGLAATGGLSPEDVALLEGKLGNPNIVAAIQQLHDGGLRQSDYDRKMNELKAQTQREMDRLKGIENGLTNWQKEAQAKVDEATRRYTEATTTRAQYEAALRRVATDYGIDVETLLPAAVPPPSPNPPAAPARTEPPAEDVTKKFQDQLDQAKRVFPFLPAELYDLGVEHQRLFGEPLSETTKIVQLAVEQSKPIREVWEETYKVADRRQTVAAEAQAAHDKQVADEAVKAYISKNATPGYQQPIGGPRSPVLSAFPGKNLGQTKPGEMTSLDRAVADFETRQATRDAAG